MIKELTPHEQLQAVFMRDPFAFFSEAFGWIPQPPKTRVAQQLMTELLTCAPDRFEDIVNKKLTLDDFEQFEKGLHFSWQQSCIIIAVHRALKGTLPAKVAILTGRGIGKSRIISLLLFYFLYTSPKPLAMATAPTATQIYGALWKEANNTLAAMRQPYKAMFVWNTDHIRRTDLPNSYYARARTANTVESLRGEHSDQQFNIADEASGVMEEVIHGGWATMNTADEKALVLISNPSGNDSLIERVFEEGNPDYLKLTFNGEQSPVVSQEDIRKRREELSGKGIKPEQDRDYCIDVLGKVPEQSATIGGFYRLFSDELVDRVLAPVSPLDSPKYNVRAALGVDPAGEGEDTATGVERAFKWARLAFEQAKSTSGTIAGAVAITMDRNPAIVARRVTIDSFGSGHDTGQIILANSSEGARRVVTPVLVGAQAPEPFNKRYINIRAMVYDAMLIWFQKGGRIETNSPEEWKRELRVIYAKKTTTSKLQIMSKDEMRRNGMKSPNKVDALSLTFVEDAAFVLDGIYRDSSMSRNSSSAQSSTPTYDKFSAIPGGF